MHETTSFATSNNKNFSHLEKCCKSLRFLKITDEGLWKCFLFSLWWLIMFSVIFCVILLDTEVFRFSHLYLPVSLLEPWLSQLPLCSPKAALSQGYSHHIVHIYFTASSFSTSDDWCHSSFVPVSGWLSTAW